MNKPTCCVCQNPDISMDRTFVGVRILCKSCGRVEFGKTETQACDRWMSGIPRYKLLANAAAHSWGNALSDNVSNPKHYKSHPSGIECIDITEHYDFCIGNAIKYLWRAGLKVEEGMSDSDKEIQDLQKAVWYINHKINKLKKEQSNGSK